MDTKPKPAKDPEPPPQQKLGDTPVAPWEMPTPEEKAKAEPVKETLKKAVQKVDSPETADAVAERLEQMAGGRTTGQVEKAKHEEQAAAPEQPVTPSEKLEQA